MRIPKTIDILGETVEIKRVKDLKDEDNNHCDGLWSFENLTIEIDSTLKGNRFKKVFLHEYGHAVLAILGFENTNLKSETEEIMVDNFARDIVKNFNISFKNQ